MLSGVAEFKDAYPNAKLIAPKDAITRHGNKKLVFDGGKYRSKLSNARVTHNRCAKVWGQDPPDTKYGFEDEVTFSRLNHCYVKTYTLFDTTLPCTLGGTLVSVER